MFTIHFALSMNATQTV